MEFTRSDLSVLFWVVGTRSGATFDEIVKHEGRRHRQPPAPEAIQHSLRRLADEHLVFLEGDRYRSDPNLQKAFLNECRNCRDTIEEIEILRRLLKAERDSGEEQKT